MKQSIKQYKEECLTVILQQRDRIITLERIHLYFKDGEIIKRPKITL